MIKDNSDNEFLSNQLNIVLWIIIKLLIVENK